MASSSQGWEASSGEPCSSAASVEECACYWCVEMLMCAAHWEECQLPAPVPPSSSWGSSLLLLLAIGGALGAAAHYSGHCTLARSVRVLIAQLRRDREPPEPEPSSSSSYRLSGEEVRFDGFDAERGGGDCSPPLHSQPSPGGNPPRTPESARLLAPS